MKLCLAVGLARHFFNFDAEAMRRHWEICQPGPDVPLYVYGPDVMEYGLHMPASKRIAYFKTGFGHDPVHSRKQQEDIRKVIAQYDLVFIDPGVVYEIYSDMPNVVKTPCSISTTQVPFVQRSFVKSLLHASAESPQKDAARSEEVMQLSGLSYEMFPKRTKTSHIEGYKPYEEFRQAYLRHDAFVHVAGDVNIHPFIDGMYTTCLLDAAASGAICFWHNTYGVKDDLLETVFDLPVDTKLAAKELREIVSSINVPKHSKDTSEEIRDKFDPEKAVAFRHEHIMKLLEEK